MAKTPGGSRIVLEQRIEKTEEMLLAGIAPSRIEAALAKEYGVSPRQVRNYIAKVYAQWQSRRQADAPHRREKVVLMAERFYARCMAQKKYGPAGQILALLLKASGAFTQDSPDHERLVAELGPPPKDPTQVLVYAQRVMAHALYEVISNPALDPERKLRWVAELGSKLGMTHAKTLVEAKLAVIEEHAGIGGGDGGGARARLEEAHASDDGSGSNPAA